MSEIDYTQPDKTFRVSTSVTRYGVAYMGPDLLVNARNADHANQVAIEKGHTPNRYFPPKEIKK